MTIEVFSGLESNDAALALLEDLKKGSLDVKQRFYFIVPNHAKFSAEISLLDKYSKLLNQDGLFATNRLQIFSFSRLAWFLTKDLDQQAKQDFKINRTGLFILVNKIIDEHFKELKNFKNPNNSTGFVEKVVDQLLEIRSSQMTVDQLLKEVKDHPEDKRRLIEKLTDLQLIENYLYDTINNQYSLEVDNLAIFCQQLDQINLHNTTIYLTGFSDFTVGELAVVKKLAEKTDLKISLINSKNQGSLFELTDKLLKELAEFSKTKKIDFKITEINQKRNLSKNQLNLEKVFLNQFNGEKHQIETIPTIDFVAATDVVAELNYVAIKIRELIHENPQISLSDILVEARSLEPYQDYLESVFETHQITPFIDLDQTMNQHPLSEFLLILFNQVDDYNFYQNSNQFLRLLKTRLLVDDEIKDFNHAVHLLENYLIEFAPNNKAFSEGFNFQTREYSDQDIKLINQLRKFMVEAIADFNQQLKSANDNKDAAIKLVKWLYKYKVDQRIIEISDQFNQNQQISQRQIQIWNQLNEALEQIVNLIGSEEFDDKKFADALSIGFNGSNFARIPAALNQLTISEAGAAQSNDFKYIFYIGANRDSLPQYRKNKSVITDDDRETLKTIFDGSDYQLKDTANQLAASEPYFFYKALMSASEQVFVSYLKNTDNKESNFVSRIKQQLVSQGVETTTTSVDGYIQDAHQLLQHKGSPRYLINQIAHLNRQGVSLGDFENEILNSDDRKLFENILSSKDYRNLGAEIDKATIKAIFNNQFNFSISQLELYNRNPYDFFLTHVLSLKERKRFEFDSRSTGNFSHQLLEELFTNLIDDNSTLAKITESDLRRNFDQLVKDLSVDDQYTNLLSTKENQVILNDLVENIWNSLTIMRDISQQNSSKTLGTEQKFENLKLPNNQEFEMVGRVDRIDQIEMNDQQVNLVIDYKTTNGGKSFDLAEAWYGLELQLLTYWLAAEQQLATSHPTKAAVFAKLIDKPKTYNDLDKEGKEEFDSFFGDNPKIPKLLAKEFSGPIDSSVKEYFGFKEKSTSTNIFDSYDFEKLKEHHQNNLKITAEKIINGLFPIFPYKKSSLNGMTYSAYKNIINFDATLGDQYNLLQENSSQIKKRLKDNHEAN